MYSTTITYFLPLTKYNNCFLFIMSIIFLSKSIQIKSGDSLWSIADEYKENSTMTIEEYVKELRIMNQLKGDTIHTGQYLTVVYFEDNRNHIGNEESALTE